MSAPRARLCSVCNYAFDVVPFAVLVNGRLAFELRLCARCRVRMLDVIETAADRVAVKL